MQDWGSGPSGDELEKKIIDITNKVKNKMQGSGLNVLRYSASKNSKSRHPSRLPRVAPRNGWPITSSKIRSA